MVAGVGEGGDTARKVPRTIRLVAPSSGPSPQNREWAVAGASESIRAQYAVLEKIGDGGMGVVYLARDHKLGRYVAIKRLNRASLESHSLTSRFFREARAVAALNHVHIVHIYALGEDEEGPYIVMEYVPGPSEASPGKTPPMPFSLADRVHRDGPLSGTDALDLMVKICHAVEYAHSCKVIHRDLKPSNVLLDGNREPKIVDFGLARKMNPGTMRLTVPGERMLSLGYSAPEQEQDATQCDERADVYGLGALLYFSLTGQNPRYFREGDVPEDLRMAIVKALETDKQKRWQSVRDLTAALLLVKMPSAGVHVPTIKSTWRCKWCDSVNPVLIRFCGKCGWDGGEQCDECGSETRVGVPFCGACGANAREYELARLLLQRMGRYREEKANELIVQQAGQISSFKPTGSGGRKMVERVHRLAEDARRDLERKARLRDLIKHDMGSGNYQLAEKHIREYDALAADDAYAEEKRRIPGLRLDQELARAREAVVRKDWNYARQICEALPAAAAADPRFTRVRMAIRRRQWTVRARDAALAAMLLALVYLLAAAPSHRWLRPKQPDLHRAVFSLASLAHDAPALSRFLELYAGWWGVPDMYRPESAVQPAPPVPPTPAGQTEQLLALRQNFEQAFEKIQRERRDRLAAWPDEYLAQILGLQQLMQKRGDFEAWSVVSAEVDRFRLQHSLPQPQGDEGTSGDSPARPPDATPPRELEELQKTYRDKIEQYSMDAARKAVALSRNYINDLTRLQTELTRKGNMDAALAVNTEIRRVRAAPEVSSAEALVARRETPKNTHGPKGN